MRSFSLILVIAVAVGVCIGSAAAAEDADIPEGYKLLYSQDFEKEKSIQDFEFTEASKWQLSDKDGNHMLECTGPGKYRGKVRSPFSIGLISDQWFGDFVLEVDLLQTGREYGHRDMCLFFGFTDPAKFYYAHMATKADPNAHNIFIVNDVPRTNIAKKTTEGIEWGDEQWHKVRLVRKVAEGTIELFFDDMTEPLMVAEDKTFGNGCIGFGSFDDAGMIDNIKIWGPSVNGKQSGFFEKKKAAGGA
jgi:hypothetical protein